VNDSLRGPIGFLGQVVQRTFYGNGVDEILAVDLITWNGTTPTTSTFWTFTDHQDSVRDIVSGNAADRGQVVEHRQYDSFGKVVRRTIGPQAGAATTSGVGVEVAFAGRPFESRTGLSDNRARWYEPATGRFVNEDPSGFKGGDANLFRYVGNDPVNQVDPSGLAAIRTSGAKTSVPAAGWAALGQQNALSMYSLYGSLGKATETAAAERTRDKQEAAQFAAASTGLFMQLFTGRAGIHDQYAEKGFPVEVRYTGRTREGIAARFADGTRYYEPTEPSNATNARVASWFLPAYRVAATGASALNVARVAIGNVFDDLASGYAGRAASDATGGRLATVPLPIGSMVMGGAVRSAASASARSTGQVGAVGPAVKNAANHGTPTIGGRVPINGKYGGHIHPSGIKFNDQGFPDFSPVSKAQVQIQGLTGNYAKDAAMANQAVGLKATPGGYVWHHVEDGVTMQLVPQPIHNATRHTGGAAVIRNGGFDR